MQQGSTYIKERTNAIMERRITSSHPDYETLNGLADAIARARNPQMWFDLSAEDPLRMGVVAANLEAEMEAQLELGRFADYIGMMDIDGRLGI
jgi:hypothetical protein